MEQRHNGNHLTEKKMSFFASLLHARVFYIKLAFLSFLIGTTRKPLTIIVVIIISNVHYSFLHDIVHVVMATVLTTHFS